MNSAQISLICRSYSKSALQWLLWSALPAQFNVASLDWSKHTYRHARATRMSPAVQIKGRKQMDPYYDSDAKFKHYSYNPGRKDLPTGGIPGTFKEAISGFDDDLGYHRYNALEAAFERDEVLRSQLMHVHGFSINKVYWIRKQWTAVIYYDCHVQNVAECQAAVQQHEKRLRALVAAAMKTKHAINIVLKYNGANAYTQAFDLAYQYIDEINKENEERVAKGLKRPPIRKPYS